MFGYSKKGKEFVSNKISQLSHEGYPKKQSIAIAFSEARQKHFKVPFLRK